MSRSKKKITFQEFDNLTHNPQYGDQTWLDDQENQPKAQKKENPKAKDESQLTHKNKDSGHQLCVVLTHLFQTNKLTCAKANG